MKLKTVIGGIALGVFLAVGAAAAATTVVVTPANPQGFSTADTRPGGAVDFVVDSTTPSGIGALHLTTDSTNQAKAQYIKEVNLPLSDVTELSYYTKQNSASFPDGDPSFQLIVNLNGDDGGYTTFVFEPYENGGGVVPGTWQSWDVDAGQMWSSRTVICGTNTITAGAGGPPFYELGDIEAACPNAVVIGIGVNVGSFNPSYDTEADLVSLNGTAYDFEPYAVATDSDGCKKDGWQTLSSADGSSFKNQGDCIQYVNTGK
jgi:hypothetical protein